MFKEVQSSWYMWLTFAFLLLGSYLAYEVTGLLPRNEYDWADKTYGIVIISNYVFFGYVCNRLVKRWPELEAWGSNSFFGVSTLLFSLGFFPILVAGLYAAVPVWEWLHFGGAVIIGLGGSVVFFATSGS